MQSNGTENPAKAPGIYMIDRDANSVKLSRRAGSSAHQRGWLAGRLFTNPPYDVYEWNETAASNASSCGEMPTVAESGDSRLQVSEDLSHIYFWVRLKGPEESRLSIGRDLRRRQRGSRLRRQGRLGHLLRRSNWRRPRRQHPRVPVLLTTAPPRTTSPQRRTRKLLRNSPGRPAYRYNDMTGHVECVSCPVSKGPDGGSSGAALEGPSRCPADGARSPTRTKQPWSRRTSTSPWMSTNGTTA